MVQRVESRSAELQSALARVEYAWRDLELALQGDYAVSTPEWVRLRDALDELREVI